MAHDSLQLVARDVTGCERCPRLRAWCRNVARVRVKRYRDQVYWGRPNPGFGDPRARAPGRGPGPGRPRRQPHRPRLHGRPLRRLPLRRPASRRLRQPAHLGLPRGRPRLVDCYIAPLVRCAPPANRPSREEMARCLEYLQREWALLRRVRAVLALGSVAQDGSSACCARSAGCRRARRTRSATGVAHDLDGALTPFRVVPSIPAEHIHRQAHGRGLDDVLALVSRHLARRLPERTETR